MPDTRTLLIAAAALGGLYLLSQAQAKPAPPTTAPPAQPTQRYIYYAIMSDGSRNLIGTGSKPYYDGPRVSGAVGYVATDENGREVWRGSEPAYTPPPPSPPAQPTPISAKEKWTRLLGIDPDIIMQKGTKISEQEWLNTEAKHYGIDPSRFVRFTGSNGTVAYAYAPGGEPRKTGEDPLGHPLLTSSTGGPIYIISWSPYMYRYNNIVYDLLAYVIESRK